MGKPMAGHLVAKGFAVIVHSRSPGPVDALVALGAERASSPADVASRATRIITMLPDSPDVERVLDGPDGVFSRLQPGTILIDTSSIAPATARALAAKAAALGATMLDAPVSGGEIGAVNATLSIMVGGDQAAFDRVKPILDVMGNPKRGQDRRLGRRADLQGLQSDGDRRHARRGQRGVRAGAQGVRRRLAGSRGAARRIRRQQGARCSRRSACCSPTISLASARRCLRRT